MSIKIKISEKGEVTLTLGEYGLVRNNSLSLRFVQTDDICDLVKKVDKMFHLNAHMEHILFTIIEDWLEQD